VAKFAAFRRIWPAPAFALVLVVGGTAVPASADTTIPLPLPPMTISLPGISLYPNATVPAPAPSVEALEATLLTKLNTERAAAGLGTLAPQPWASSVARAHSREMAAARDIWHNHTGYLDIAKHTIGAYLTGENVAEAGTLDEADSLLMNSPPHRANILYPAFNDVGIGVALDAAGYVYVTQDFVTIKPAPAAEVAGRTPAAPVGTVTGGPPGKTTHTPAMARPAVPVAAVPRVAAAAVPLASPSIAKPAMAVATPVPGLSPLAASPVAATSHISIRRLEGRLGIPTGRLKPPSLPAAVWAIVLATVAGVSHRMVRSAQTRTRKRLGAAFSHPKSTKPVTNGPRTPDRGMPTSCPDYGTYSFPL
jgi:uncharacterized protein YkwD